MIISIHEGSCEYYYLDPYKVSSTPSCLLPVALASSCCLAHGRQAGRRMHAYDKLVPQVGLQNLYHAVKN